MNADMQADIKKGALLQIAHLARRYDITTAEIAAEIAGNPTPAHEKSTSLIKTLLSYIGGIFIFSGIGLLINMIWDDIGSAERVIITFGPGLTAFILGILGMKDRRFEKAVTPLFLIAALAQPAGLFVFLHEYAPDSSDTAMAAIAVAAIMLAQQFLAFMKWKRTSLLFFTLVFWTMLIGTALSRLDAPSELIGTALGLSLLCLSASIASTPHRAITPFWYFWSTLFLLGGYFDGVNNTMLELTYLGLNAFMIYLSIRLASRTMLFVSAIGLLSWLGWFTDKYFAHITGWPVALIVMGFLMIGLSAYAFKLGQKIGRAGN